MFRAQINKSTRALLKGAAILGLALTFGAYTNTINAGAETSAPQAASNGGTPNDAPMDLNGDGKSDYVVVRNVGGQIRWFYATNGAQTLAADWGISTDFFVCEDFDGDDKDDITVFRPSAAAGQTAFYILNSATQTARVERFGEMNDNPTIVDDYDGDNKADLAVYRRGATSTAPSTWFYRGSLNNPNGNTTFVPWGRGDDLIMPGDRDGDGRADFTIQRNNGAFQGEFWTRLSTGATLPVVTFGNSGDLILPGDYDGDGKTDIATARGSGGQIAWYWLRSSDNQIVGPILWGLTTTDLPVQGDYDGDGMTEPAVWRPNADPDNNFFYSRNSSNGALTAFELGRQFDYPVGNFNTH